MKEKLEPDYLAASLREWATQEQKDSRAMPERIALKARLMREEKDLACVRTVEFGTQSLAFIALVVGLVVMRGGLPRLLTLNGFLISLPVLGLLTILGTGIAKVMSSDESFGV